MVFTYERTANGDFKCPHCDFVKTNQSTVHMHIVAKHSGTYKHKCKDCNYETSIKQTLDNHIAARHPDRLKEAPKEFECIECDFKSQKKAGLRSHYLLKHLTTEVTNILGKTEEGHCQCTHCGTLFKSKPAFVYHTPGCLPVNVIRQKAVRDVLGLPALV